jgi:hypothetical protein
MITPFTTTYGFYNINPRNYFGSTADERQALAEREKANESRVSRLIAQKCAELGSWTFEEILVANLFAILVLLWFFRCPFHPSSPSPPPKKAEIIYI